MPSSAETAIPMRALLAGARRKERSLLDLTRRLVAAESPSDAKSAVDACVALAAAHFKQLGGRVKLHRQPRYGNILEARFGPRRSARIGAKPILLLGHLDTVWPLGTLESMPCRLREGRLWGPGTLDMKAGVAMAATAIELLAEADLLRREIVAPAQRRRRDRQSRFAARHRRARPAVRRGLRARTGAGAGLQNRAQGHRRLADSRERRRRPRQRGL